MPLSADTNVPLSTQAVELAEGVYWVGKRPPNQIFYANPYLIFDPAAPNVPPFSLLIDPGSGGDFAVVRSKVEGVMGPISQLDAIFINHQDPDVSASLSILMEPKNSMAYMLCSDETWQLIETLGIPQERYLNVDDYPQGFKGLSGRTLLPVPSPFCHFVGARMLYCPQSQILFTGDLFASLTARDAVGLFADESDWVGMRAFHQIYMPTNRALTMAIQKIRALRPHVRMIAPQHGRVLQGPILQEFMDRLEALDVGLDILDARDDQSRTLPQWREVFHRILTRAQALHEAPIEPILLHDPALRNYLIDDRGTLTVEHTGKRAIERAIATLAKSLPAEAVDAIKYETLQAALELQLPTPTIDFDEAGPRNTQRAPSPFEAV